MSRWYCLLGCDANPSYMYAQGAGMLFLALICTSEYTTSLSPIYMGSRTVFIGHYYDELKTPTGNNQKQEKLLHGLHHCTDLPFSPHLLTHYELTQPSPIATPGHLKVARSMRSLLTASLWTAMHCVFSAVKGKQQYPRILHVQLPPLFWMVGWF